MPNKQSPTWHSLTLSSLSYRVAPLAFLPAFLINPVTPIQSTMEIKVKINFILFDRSKYISVKYFHANCNTLMKRLQNVKILLLGAAVDAVKEKGTLD